MCNLKSLRVKCTSGFHTQNRKNREAMTSVYFLLYTNINCEESQTKPMHKEEQQQKLINAAALTRTRFCHNSLHTVAFKL